MMLLFLGAPLGAAKIVTAQLLVVRLRDARSRLPMLLLRGWMILLGGRFEMGEISS